MEPDQEHLVATVGGAVAGFVGTASVRDLSRVVEPRRIVVGTEYRGVSLGRELNGAKTLLLNNPHNPTGKVFTRYELERILEPARRYDVFVISDEVHGPLTLPGSTYIPWLTLDQEALRRGFVITAASKAFNLAGLKCAAMVANGSVRNLYTRQPTEFAPAPGPEPLGDPALPGPAGTAGPVDSAAGDLPRLA